MPTSEKCKRIVIVGGVAGGASAAARARRLSESAEIIMLERGEHVSFANCGLPYHIGGVIEDRQRLLVQTPEALRRRFRIDVRTRTEAIRINRGRQSVTARDLQTGAESEIEYDALILSPGAAPLRPPLPGIDSNKVFTLRNIADMDAIKRVVDGERPAHSVVIGGGYIGLEMAEALRERGVGVTLVELSPQVMAPADLEMAAPLHQQLELHGVDLRLETSVTGFDEVDGQLQVRLNQGEPVACGLAILAIGVRPEVTLAREAGLAIGERGGIAVDETMRTDDPNIYAVGDAVEVIDFVAGGNTLIPLAGPANRQGRIAADNIFGRASTYKKTQGTAICKVFDLAIGMTGMSEKSLKRAGRPYEKVYVHPGSHAGYYPGASAITLKLIFEPETGKILGAQAVGADGVDKRIDVLAVAIRAGLTVYDLEELELSYAPPYGSAKDPVNYAGFAAANVLRGDTALCHSEDVQHPGPNQFLLDVRTPVEFAAGAIPGAVNVPLDDLRERLAELPRDKELLVYCQAGLRGYLAGRILDHHGFNNRNLSGGYKLYQYATHKPKPDPVGNGSGGNGAAALKKEAVQRPAGLSCCNPAAATGKPQALATEPAGKVVDARGLQCPGPIMRLASELEQIAAGESLTIQASDPGFASDVDAWCRSTGQHLVGVERRDGHYEATISKGRSAPAREEGGAQRSKGKTIVVFSNDLDKALAAFIIANGAAAMGSQVTLFFTFWGLNILRRAEAPPVSKNPVERMFGWMMPRGADKLTLSKMNMLGAGARMIKGIMRSKNVSPLPELIQSARESGVKLVSCAMSMDLMGIKQEELIEGVEMGGVAMYLQQAENSGVNLFI